MEQNPTPQQRPKCDQNQPPPRVASSFKEANMTTIEPEPTPPDPDPQPEGDDGDTA